jgi:Tripartite tricarboxylate transporter TctB family
LTRKDAIGGIVIFFFGALTAVLSLKMDLGTFRAAGSGMFPLCLALLLMALSAIYTISVLLQGVGTAGSGPQSPETAASAKPVMFFVGAMAGAVVLLGRIGYGPTAFFLVMALLQILGMKRWRLNLLIALVASAVSYFLFVQWLKIPFPKGWLGL